MIVLIDNGHGCDTAGKCSPDGRLREYKYSREIAAALCDELKAQGYDARRIVIETLDVKLRTRCQRVNAICRQADAANVLLVSIHCNAAGSDGRWHDARGWSAHISLNASQRSKNLAHCLADGARAVGLKVRTPMPGRDYWPQNLAICRDTNCAAVLTENLFQDNRDDVDYLLSDAGRAAIVAAHVKGIINYIKQSK